jgi:ribose 5-phosphate isomerase B
VAVNKMTGLRGAICHDTYSAHQGVEHDDMNVLCLGARIIGRAIPELVGVFERELHGERHERRLARCWPLKRPRATRSEGAAPPLFFVNL